MSIELQFKHLKAERHRKLLGNSDLTKTADKVISTLQKGGIQGMIIGGYAVQHHGYPRTTTDIDIVVNNIEEASDYLSIRGFKVAQGTNAILYDRSNGVEINLLETGKPLVKGTLPPPTPNGKIVELEHLISNKLSSYSGSPAVRLKDIGDVSELIQRNALPRALIVDPSVAQLYVQLWDQIQKDIENNKT